MTVQHKSSGKGASRRAPSLRVFASMWSLRQYPTQAKEWSWPRKFAAIRDAGFAGIMSPPRPEIAERGGLAYLAITSIQRRAQIAAPFRDALALGAERLVVQLGDVDSGHEHCVKLAMELVQRGIDSGLPVEIETHRDTWLETPEKTLELAKDFQRRTGRRMPVCFDHSHFAVVRHLAPPYWPKLVGDRALLSNASVFHLRPFNGHHCQIPVTRNGRGRAPEYPAWLEFVRELFQFMHENGRHDIIAVPEIGHAAPAYRLACFPDTWTDTRAALNDLKKTWAEVHRTAARR